MNKNNWELYKASGKGKRVIAIFEPDTDRNNIDAAADFYTLQEEYCQSPMPFDSMMYFYICTQTSIEAQDLHIKDEHSRDQYSDFIDKLIIYAYTDDSLKPNGVIAREQDYRNKGVLLSFISVYLYLNYYFFKPILFASRFDLLQRACNNLGIQLPPIPRTTDYRAYILYYFDICVALDAFQQENHLSDAEFCACLYDYALNYLGTETTPSGDLPAPTNVWLTGANKRDIEDIAINGIRDTIWACNERTRRGDIVIVYALAPHSCIHSIWRADSNGFFCPFDYYHCRTNVARGAIVPIVTNKELKAHPYFSQLPIVRKNMQGVNGVGLKAQDYAELLKLFASKGFNTSMLPQLYHADNYNAPDVHIEKDVEEKILMPFLERLGFAAADYTRQLTQKAGRGLKAIPDFVFLPHGEPHFQTAPLIIEAKYDMGAIRELHDAFAQALSYARLMRSNLMAICDKERLIIYRLTEGAADINKPVFENYWAAIATDTDVFLAAKKLIGRDALNA